MSFDPGSKGSTEGNSEPVPDQNNNGSKANRKSFRVNSSAPRSTSNDSEIAQPNRSEQTEVVITSVPPEVAAPLNDNLSEITIEERSRNNNPTQVQHTKDNIGNEWQESSAFKGRRPGDRYIRFSRTTAMEDANARFNQDRLLVSSTESADPLTGFGRFWLRIKRLLIGTPLPSSEAMHQRLSKITALAVLSSDALSSTAYATEQILLVLVATQGEHLGLVIPISLAIAFLLVIVGLSYRQTIHAYPLGGGSYIVAKDNLGVTPGLIAAASLMIDYVLTVAVSITAGIAALTSAIPNLQPWTVELCLASVALISIANLRGVRESGAIFTAPTYIFIFSIVLMLIFGFLNWIGIVIFTPVIRQIPPLETAEQLSLFVLLRAFSSGCSAMTGVEAISDGVPAFRKPESKNASTTLVWMVIILVTLFLGITLLANHFSVRPLEEGAKGYETVVSLVAHQAVGDSPIYFLVQFSTTLILVLAANTAFSDFPRLSWFLARDKFLPHLFSHKGDRLAFSTGIITLAFLSSILIVVFGGSTDALIPLYAIGVFNSFSLSQAGMVRRWWRLRTPGWQRSIIFNGLGAVLTFIVLIITAATKFTSGAWVVILLIPIIYMMFRLILRHYERFQNQLSSGDTVDRPLNMANHTVFVPINGLNPITRRTLTYARSLSDNVTAIHVNDDPELIAQLREQWDEADLDIPLVVVETPYRAILGPFLAYVDSIHKREPDETITVVIPEFITAKWWQQLLHNQTALRLKTSLLLRPGIVVTSVPYHLRQ